MRLIENNFFKDKPHFFVLFLIFITYSFSVLCRFYWIYWASEFNEYFFNNELMIISNDGYAFAEGARDMIAGFHQDNDLSYYGSSLSTLTYWIYKITPFSLETIILYMSVFFSSLIVIPIILISNEYKKPLAGFIAALLACIANSYYNRTMAGYYDTDMLVITLPMFIIFFMIRLINKKDFISLFALPFFVSFYLWWYPSSYALNFALIGLLLIYSFIFHRKENIFYLAFVLMIIAISSISWFYQFAIISLIIALFAFKNEYFKIKFIIFLGLLSVVLLIISGGLDPIIYQLKFYIFKTENLGPNTKSFVYFNVNQTIQEVESIDYSTFMQRISSNELVFIFSFIGFLLLIKKQKSAILMLPMLCLGFLALRGGLRFTIYSVGVMALGYGYFVCYFIDYFNNLKNKKKKDIKFYQVIFIFLAIVFILINLLFESNIFILSSIFTCFLLAFLLLNLKVFNNKFYLDLNIIFWALIIALIPALLHIYNYKAPSVFNKKEVEILIKLKNQISPNDYIVSWWDYGYPIRYYADSKTLVDGGKHLGKDNFFPSFILSKDEKSAANMARLSVEYTEKSFKNNYNDILMSMMKDYNHTNIDLFLSSLKNDDFKLKTPKTTNVYFYLPARMAPIFSTVSAFSYINLEDGKINKNFSFSTAIALKQTNDAYLLSNGMILSNDFRSFEYDNNTFLINSFIEINSIKKADYKITKLNQNGKFYLFFIKDFSVPYTQFIFMDDNMFNSSYVQMFFFNKYDKNLFDLIINEKEAKVFKLKK